ncbi:hypothetical protein [Methanimicrococcus blatticola]|uniref:hypothetical protein n=1 Tax=Methanimicrococcus blatticola TaxID=91560 RepID=UPI00105BBBAE|nr:hypothetical protein [Methanimicrococcus blatticola]MBZ3936050.1 hypothetical protein [Methanimicrococcus blatticola]MCC2509338.1 hypothetical protein [Methanimicrococcus blatticola]
MHLLFFITPVRLRERNRCYLPFVFAAATLPGEFAAATCRLHLPSLPATAPLAQPYAHYNIFQNPKSFFEKNKDR